MENEEHNGFVGWSFPSVTIIPEQEQAVTQLVAAIEANNVDAVLKVFNDNPNADFKKHINEQGERLTTFAKRVAGTGVLIALALKLYPGDGLFGKLPIMKAVSAGDLSAVNCLLTATTSVQVKDGRGWTLLHFAARHGQSEMATFLLENEVGANVVNEAGETALHYAAGFCHDEVVGILVQNGAQLEAKDNQGFTAIHWATIHGKMKLVEQLHKLGADVNATTNDGRSALSLAREYSLKDISNYLEKNGAIVPPPLKGSNSRCIIS